MGNMNLFYELVAELKQKNIEIGDKIQFNFGEKGKERVEGILDSIVNNSQNLASISIKNGNFYSMGGIKLGSLKKLST